MSGGSFAGPYSGNDSQSIEWDLVGKDLTITCWVKIPNDVTWNNLGSFGVLGTMADLGNHNSARSGLSIGAGNTEYPNWHACFNVNIAPSNVSAKVTVNTTYKGGFQFPITWSDDDWHLITVTYKFGATDANDYQIYFDNAQTLGATSGTPPAAILTSGWTTIPGRRSGLGGSLTTSGGTTSYKQREFVIWDRILTSAERTTVYNSGVPLGNTASYPSGAVTGWMFENNIEVDPTYYNSQQKYTGRVTLKNAFDNSKYPIVSNYDVFNTDPSSYNSVQTNHISIPQVQNNPGTSSGVPGMTTANLVTSDLTRSIPYSSYSMSFGGVSRVQLANATGLNFGTGDFTYSLWVNTVDNGNNYFFGNSTDASANNGTIAFGIHSANDPSWRIWVSGETIDGTLSVSDSWKHCVIRRTSGVINVFVNSVKDTSTGTLARSITNVGNIMIGTFGGAEYINGEISNFAIWDSSLTEDQIITIYNGGVPNNISSLSPTLWYSLGSDSYFNGNDFICPDLSTGSNDGTSTGMGSTALLGVGPGSTANGTATGMNIPANLQGNAPNSTKNAFSINMTETDRETSVPS